MPKRTKVSSAADPHGTRTHSSTTPGPAGTTRPSASSSQNEKHSQLATQLTALEAINTDATAIDYRDRLVATHQALGEKYKTHATATESRDMQRITLERSGPKSLLTEYAALCNEKNSVMATLKQRYDCEFDVAE